MTAMELASDSSLISNDYAIVDGWERSWNSRESRSPSDVSVVETGADPVSLAVRFLQLRSDRPSLRLYCRSRKARMGLVYCLTATNDLENVGAPLRAAIEARSLKTLAFVDLVVGGA